MGSKSNYLENEILDHILGGADFSRPGTVYVGLWAATLSDASTGSTAGQPVGNNYARVAVTNNGTNWPAASGGAKANGAAITFPQASGSWGTVTDFAICDAATDGNILYWGTLGTPNAIGSGDTPSFAIGELDITES